MLRRLGIVLSLALATACVADEQEDLAATEQELEIGDVIYPLPDCSTADPHKILYVGTGYSTPPSDLPVSVHSTNAAYYYSGCGRFVVDMYVGSSPAGMDLEMLPAAHDLPSSAQVGGELPANPLDCAYYRKYQTIWHKKGNGAWTKIGYANQKGVWSATYGCQAITYAGDYDAFMNLSATAGAGWDVYRVAASVKLRTSGQAAKVTIGEWIAPPR
jgi:hypothetical protein